MVRTIKGEGQGVQGVSNSLISHAAAQRTPEVQRPRCRESRLGIVLNPECTGYADSKNLRYVGWFHKLHAEPGEDKVTFANDIADWIIQRTQSATKPQSKL